MCCEEVVVGGLQGQQSPAKRRVASVSGAEATGRLEFAFGRECEIPVGLPVARSQSLGGSGAGVIRCHLSPSQPEEGGLSAQPGGAGRAGSGTYGQLRSAGAPWAQQCWGQTAALPEWNQERLG